MTQLPFFDDWRIEADDADEPVLVGTRDGRPFRSRPVERCARPPTRWGTKPKIPRALILNPDFSVFGFAKPRKFYMFCIGFF